MPGPNCAVIRFLIERNNFHFRVRKIFGNESTGAAEAVVRVRNCEIDGLDANFQNVARFGPFDKNWPRQNMPARAFIRCTASSA